MDFWILFLIVSIIAVIVEIFVPAMFCINFAIAGLITAVVSIFWETGFINLIILFSILSLLSIIFMRPLLLKFLKKGNTNDFKDQYIGKVVACIETITAQSGAVTIYDERWEARLSTEGEEIPVGKNVKIVRHDGLILYVEKI